MARGSKSSYFVDRASVRETDAAPHALTAVSRINKPSRLCVFAVAFPFASLRLRGCFPLRVFASSRLLSPSRLCGCSPALSYSVLFALQPQLRRATHVTIFKTPLHLHRYRGHGATCMVDVAATQHIQTRRRIDLGLAGPGIGLLHAGEGGLPEVVLARPCRETHRARARHRGAESRMGIEGLDCRGFGESPAGESRGIEKRRQHGDWTSVAIVDMVLGGSGCCLQRRSTTPCPLLQSSTRPSPFFKKEGIVVCNYITRIGNLWRYACV